MPLPTLLSVDKHRGIPRGARTYLLLTGWTSGLIAQGYVQCAPFLAARLDRPGTVSQHVMVEWTQTLGLADRIPLEILQAEMPEAGWLPLTRDESAIPLTNEHSELVRRLWHQWIDRREPAGRRIVRSDLVPRG
jgi:hypothetical protein